MAESTPVARGSATTWTVPPSKNAAVVPALLRLIQSRGALLVSDDDGNILFDLSVTCSSQHKQAELFRQSTF